MLRERKARLGALLAVAILLVSLLGACGRSDDGSSSGEASGDGPYRIGFTDSLSGPSAFIGQQSLAGLRTAIDYVNAEGGVNGRKIKLIAHDYGGTPQGGIAAVRELSSQDVLAIYGLPVSSVLEAAARNVERAGIPLITTGGTEATLIPAQKYIFQADATSVSDAEPMAAFAADLLGGSGTVTLAPIETAGSAEWANNIQSEWAQRHGLTVDGSTVLPLTSADISTQAQRVARTGADAILTEAVGALLATFVDEVRGAGYQGPIVAFHTAGSYDILEKLEDDQVYILGEIYPPGESAEGKPGLKRYRDALKAAGTVADANGSNIFPLGYIGGVILVEALEKCGENCSSSDLQEALDNLSFDTEGLTAAPEISFTPEVHQGLRGGFFYHWKDGAIVPALDGKVFENSTYNTAD